MKVFTIFIVAILTLSICGLTKASGVKNWSPESARIFLNFVSEYRDVSSWSTVVESDAVFNEISERMHASSLGLSGNVKTQIEALENTTEKRIDTIFSDWKLSIIEQCRKQDVCELAEEYDKNPDKVVIDTISKAKVAFLRIYPHLTTILKIRKKWPKTQKEIIKFFNDARKAYVRFETDLAIARKALDLPAEIQSSIVKISQHESKLLQEFIKGHDEKQKNPKLLLEERDQLGIYKAARVRHEELVEHLIPVAEAVRAFVKSNEQMANTLEMELNSLANINEIIDLRPLESAKNCTPEATDFIGSSTYLRFKIDSNKSGTFKQSKRRVTFKPYLVIPINKADPCLGSEELWLGYRAVDYLQMRDGRIESQASLANIRLESKEALQNVVDRLGLPKVLQFTLTPHKSAFKAKGILGPGGNGEVEVIIEGTVDLPMVDIPAVFSLKFDPEALSISSNFYELIENEFTKIHQVFKSRLAKVELKYPQSNRPIAIIKNLNLHSTAKQLKTGDIRLKGTIEYKSFGQLPVMLQAIVDQGKPHLRLTHTFVPASFLEVARSKLQPEISRVYEKLALTVSETINSDTVRTLADYATLTTIALDPKTAELQAIIVLNHPFLPEKRRSVTVTISPKTGSVKIKSLELAIKGFIQDYAAEIQRRIHLEAEKRAKEYVQKQVISLFGMKGRIQPDGSVLVEQQPYALRISNINIDVKQAVEKGKVFEGIDFSQTTIQPYLLENGKRIPVDWKTIMSKVSGITLDGDHLLVQPVKVRDGIGFNVTLQNLPFLGTLSAGTVVLTPTSTRFDQAIDIRQILVEVLNQRIQGSMDIQDIGPVVNITPNITGIESGSFNIKLMGGIQLPQGPFGNIQLPVIIHVLPFAPPKIESKDVESAVKDGLIAYLGASFSSSGISVEIKDDSPPYGVYVSGALPVIPPALELRIHRAAITTSGVQLPDRLTTQMPGFVPIGPLAFVNPRVSFSPKTPETLGIGADVTIGSQGVEKIIKISSDIEMNLQRHTLTFMGKGVLGHVLPIFEAEGKIDIPDGTVTFGTQTLGEVKKIIDINGDGLLDGKNLVVAVSGSYRLFGEPVQEAEILINDPKNQIRIAGKYKTLLEEVGLGVIAKTDLSLVGASGEFGFSVGPFDIAGAKLAIAPKETELDFDFKVFSVMIRAPGPENITPQTVLDVLYSLLDVDLSLNIKKLKDIEISLFNEQGEPVENTSVGDASPTQSKNSTASAGSGPTGGGSAPALPSTSDNLTPQPVQTADMAPPPKANELKRKEKKVVKNGGSKQEQNAVRAIRRGDVGWRVDRQDNKYKLFRIYKTKERFYRDITKTAKDIIEDNNKLLLSRYWVWINKSEFLLPGKNWWEKRLRPVWLFAEKSTAAVTAVSMHPCANDKLNGCPKNVLGTTAFLSGLIKKELSTTESNVDSPLWWADWEVLRLLTEGAMAPENICLPKITPNCASLGLKDVLGYKDSHIYSLIRKNRYYRSSDSTKGNEPEGWISLIVRSAPNKAPVYNIPLSSPLAEIILDPKHKARQLLIESRIKDKPLHVLWNGDDPKDKSLLLGIPVDSEKKNECSTQGLIDLYGYYENGQTVKKARLACHDWNLFSDWRTSFNPGDEFGQKVYHLLYELGDSRHTDQVHIFSKDLGEESTNIILATRAGGWDNPIYSLDTIRSNNLSTNPAIKRLEIVAKKKINTVKLVDNLKNAICGDIDQIWSQAINNESTSLKIMENLLTITETAKGFCTPPIHVFRITQNKHSANWEIKEAP